MKSPAEQIALYLRKTGITPAEFSRIVGVSDSLVCRWLSGKRRPGGANAFTLERVSGGELKAAELLKRKGRRPPKAPPVSSIPLS